MKDGAYLERGDWPWLASLLVIGCLTLGVFALTAYRFTGGQGGVPLDDAWIHFQFARNLARGDGLSFNPGHPTSGSTAPLWTLLLAAMYRAGGGLPADGPAAGQLLSAACFLAALVTTYALGKRLMGNRWAAWLAGAVVATNGRMVWAGLSALETCLFATLSLLAISAHLSDRAAHCYRPRTAALFGLAALARPEGYLLFVLAMADSAWSSWHRPERAGTRPPPQPSPMRGGSPPALPVHAGGGTGLKEPVLDRRPTQHRLFTAVLVPIVIFAAVVLPYLIFSLRTSGHLLPNTYHAKAVIDFRPDLVFLSGTSQCLILDNFLLLPFFVLGLGVLLHRAPLLSLWSVGLPLGYAFLHAIPYQHGRYLMPLIPCNAVIGVVGLLEARHLTPWPLSLRGKGESPLPEAGRGWGRGLAALVSILVVAGTAWRLPTMASKYAWNVDNINKMHVALGRWVMEHTPPDAVLALNDIGAITYISERPVVDLAGLVTPEVVPLLRAPDRDSLLADFMAERDVQYVIIFPDWFPDLAARRDLLEPVHQVTLEHRTVAGGETMVVYRAHWHESD